MKFTERAVRALRPAAARYEVFEAGRNGFGIRVSPAGVKSWIFVYRRRGKLNRVTLGRYPKMTLAEAHAKHAALRVLLDKDIDPAQEERYAREEALKAPTVLELANHYLERHARPHKRSWAEDERILRKDILPRWGHRKAQDITRREVVALLDDIVDRGAPIAANRTLACIRKMYNFAIGRSILETSPCLAIKAPGKLVTRDRVLSDDEIRTFWTRLNTSSMTRPIQLALLLQLVTAQRKGEVRAARWEDFDLKSGWWTIPAVSSKNGLSHRVPLSPLALAILDEIRHLADASSYLFPSRGGDRPIVHTAIDHALRLHQAHFGLERFTPHDLRRTAASQMTSLGISRLVVSKVLNHAESGVTAVYDRHSYDAEKREALTRWADNLERLVGSDGANAFEPDAQVLALRRAAA
ncbi:MAG: tyrosine-type recombinase/integrase [Pseudomonadota bacterium]